MSQHHKKRKHHHHKRTQQLDWRDSAARYAVGIGAAVAVVVLVAGAIVGWGLYQSNLYQKQHGPELEAEFGFKTSSAYVEAGGSKVEVLTIQPVPKGYMDKMGFREGDIITSHTPTDFYKLLYEQRGETVSVDTVDGGNGLPIVERKVLTRRFLVPPKP